MLYHMDIPKRCQMEDCKIKLKIMDQIECKCKKYFCRKHRFFSEHDCTYNYKTEHIKKLEKENPKIIRKKFERI